MWWCTRTCHESRVLCTTVMYHVSFLFASYFPCSFACFTCISVLPSSFYSLSYTHTPSPVYFPSMFPLVSLGHNWGSGRSEPLRLPGGWPPSLHHSYHPWELIFHTKVLHQLHLQICQVRFATLFVTSLTVSHESMQTSLTQWHLQNKVIPQAWDQV